MLSGYKLTEMEKKIETLYKENGILTPSDLSIQNLSRVFNVKVDLSINGSKREQRAIWDEDFTVIFLDPDQPEEKQREVFFHEFGHPLLHCGNQIKMKNKSFRDLQEAQANQFQLYAAIPFFMLKELELPPYEFQLIKEIQTVFKVPKSLAKKRLDQIKRRIFQSKIDTGEVHFYDDYEELAAETKESYTVNSPSLRMEDLFTPVEIKQLFPARNKSKNKIYFKYFNGKPLPVYYCIEVSRGDVNWGEKLKRFPIDCEFEVLSMDEFDSKETDAPVFAELKLHPLYPNDFAINLSSLKKKLLFFDIDPYNIRRFVIDAKFLEELLQLDLFSSSLDHYHQLPETKTTKVNL